MMARQYITTAIDYPNAAPHMGHVLEKVLADSIARWFRLRGDDVCFQIGTDEHGTKIQRITRQCEEHQAWLSGLILESGGAPAPRVGSAMSADLHFQALDRMLPRIKADHEHLLKLHRKAAGMLVEQPRATALIERIIVRLQEHVATFESLINDGAALSPA